MTIRALFKPFHFMLGVGFERTDVMGGACVKLAGIFAETETLPIVAHWWTVWVALPFFVIQIETGLHWLDNEWRLKVEASDGPEF